MTKFTILAFTLFRLAINNSINSKVINIIIIVNKSIKADKLILAIFKILAMKSVKATIDININFLEY